MSSNIAATLLIVVSSGIETTDIMSRESTATLLSSEAPSPYLVIFLPL